MNEWSALFASGRLHKGYISLLATDSTNRSFDEALYKNRVTALRTSLLLLPETFTLYELLSTLIGISYTGDCRRLLLLENQSKYRRIVADQWPYLARVYLSLVIPVLEEANQALLASPSTSARVFADMDRDNIIVERTSSLVNRLLRRLPSIEELEAQAEARLANTLSNEKTGHRLGQPISSIVGTLATTPGSPMAERLTVPRLFQPYLFDALPENLKRHAGKASVQIRFGRLFSPAELLAQHRHVKLGWGYPAPQDPPALQRAIRDMTRNSSLGAVKLSLNTITPSRTVRLI